MANELEIATRIIAAHEGFRQFPYRDTKSILTIGYGRNLESNGLSRDEGRLLLSNDIDVISQALADHLPFWVKLDAGRRAALIDMGMMGVGKLLGFHEMLAALARGDFAMASQQALASKWAEDVGDRRSHDIATLLRCGMKIDSPE